MTHKHNDLINIIFCTCPEISSESSCSDHFSGKQLLTKHKITYEKQNLRKKVKNFIKLNCLPFRTVRGNEL